MFKASTRDFSDCSSFGHIVKDSKSIIGSLQTCSFSHVRRQGNTATHALVRRAKKSSPLYGWKESTPPDISFFFLFCSLMELFYY